MEIENFSGCCRASELYNLGGAHGHETADNQEEFDSRVAGENIVDGHSYIAITNGHQRAEREYLTTQGWTTAVLPGRWPELNIHTINGTDLIRYLRERNAVRPVQGRFQAPAAPAPNPVPAVPPQPPQPAPVANVLAEQAALREQPVPGALGEGAAGPRGLPERLHQEGNVGAPEEAAGEAREARPWDQLPQRTRNGLTIHRRFNAGVVPVQPANVDLNYRRNEIRLNDVIDFCDFEAALVGAPQVTGHTRLTDAMKNRLEYEYGIRLDPNVFYSVGTAHRSLVQRARDPRRLFERN